MKSSDGEAEGNPDHVLHLLGGDGEVAGDRGEAVAGLEAVDEILDARSAVYDERLAERLARIDGDVGGGVGGQPQPLGPSVVTVGDALEVAANDLREVLLSGTDDREERLVVAAGGVVEDQLSAVGVHLPRCERMVEANLGAEPGDRRADALEGHAGTAKRAQHERLGEADEGNRRAAAGRRKHRDEGFAVLRVGPGVERRDGRAEIRGALAQSEQRDAETRVVAPQRTNGCRGGSQNPIVPAAPVVVGLACRNARRRTATTTAPFGFASLRTQLHQGCSFC